DEPLSNLDSNLREEMQFEIRRIQNEVWITTLMVTHDQAEALSICDRVVVMQAGRITQIDEPYTHYEHPRTRFISGFVGKANMLQGDLD
ncbi:ABC transporter ATP-binding protein, partial [Pseudomonas syringae pv. tagetis]